MIPPLDIFRVAPDGHLIWRVAAQDFESAQRRIKLLMGAEPSDYVIYRQKTDHKTLVGSEKPS